MHLAVVIGTVVSTVKNPAYENRKQLLVQKIDLDRKPLGIPTVAIDYVNAGEGDIVLLGAAPGLASTVFNIPNAPIRELVMGIVDRVQFCDNRREFGNSVSEEKEAKK